MRNNETGEYELVVGNRQLLSGFFIVVLLCAAAFAMGYVVGENTHSSRPVETALSGAGKAMDAQPDARAPETRASAPLPATPSNPAPDTPSESRTAAETAAADAPPRPVTQPARDVEPETPPARPKREVVKTPEPRPAAEAAPGQYWQVTATSNRNSAETLVQSLRDKGFPAILSSGADNLTHVMVGPYRDTVSLGRAKTDLENHGFTQLVRK